MMLYISVSINFRRNKLGLIIYKIYWNENLLPRIQSITLLKHRVYLWLLILSPNEDMSFYIRPKFLFQTFAFKCIPRSF